MPPKVKKKTPKQLLAEAEVQIVALKGELLHREKELGDTIHRLSSSVTECKAVIIRQDEVLAKSFNVREVALRVELAEARDQISRLQTENIFGKEAIAAYDSCEAERAQLQRQLAETVGTREVMEKVHTAEAYALKQSLVSLRAQMEDKFKVSLFCMCCLGLHRGAFKGLQWRQDLLRCATPTQSTALGVAAPPPLRSTLSRTQILPIPPHTRNHAGALATHSRAGAQGSYSGNRRRCSMCSDRGSWAACTGSKARQGACWHCADT